MSGIDPSTINFGIAAFCGVTTIAAIMAGEGKWAVVLACFTASNFLVALV